MPQLPGGRCNRGHSVKNVGTGAHPRVTTAAVKLFPPVPSRSGEQDDDHRMPTRSLEVAQHVEQFPGQSCFGVVNGDEQRACDLTESAKIHAGELAAPDHPGGPSQCLETQGHLTGEARLAGPPPP